MKAHLSVLMLYITRRLTRFLLLLIGLFAVNSAAFFILDVPFGDEDIIGVWSVVFLAALIVCCFILLEHSTGKYDSSLTLLRLQVNEYCLLLWDSLANALFLLLFWFGELLNLAVLGLFFGEQVTDQVGPQGIVMAFYKSPFLHGLMPLVEGGLWVRNGLILFCIALLLAVSSLMIRHGKKSLTAAFCIPFWFMGSFAKDVGEELYIGIGMVIVITAGCVVWALFTAHPGKERKEEDEA